jgi:threonine dehydratase
MSTATSIQNQISIEEIMKAQHRLAGVVMKSPYIRNYNLSEFYGCNLWLKREDLQVVRSFKIRGAFNKIKSLDEAELKKGIICASAGNHAQGVAFACAHLSISGTIVMPSTTPSQKVKKVQHFGKDKVKIILEGDTFDDAYKVSLDLQKETDAVFIHPFDDDLVIAGQGTIACEIVEESKESLDYLFVAVGGGGLISGISSYMKKISPTTKIIAVEAAGAPAMYNSIKAGKRVMLDSIDGFADGVAVKEIGSKTFKICQTHVDDFLLVEEGAICSSILRLYNEEAIVAEPAGAIGIAALDQYSEKIKGKNVGVIICGGNNDVARTEEIREALLYY